MFAKNVARYDMVRGERITLGKLRQDGGGQSIKQPSLLRLQSIGIGIFHSFNVPSKPSHIAKPLSQRGLTNVHA